MKSKHLNYLEDFFSATLILLSIGALLLAIPYIQHPKAPAHEPDSAAYYQDLVDSLTLKHK